MRKLSVLAFIFAFATTACTADEPGDPNPGIVNMPAGGSSGTGGAGGAGGAAGAAGAGGQAGTSVAGNGGMAAGGAGGAGGDMMVAGGGAGGALGGMGGVGGSGGDVADAGVDSGDDGMLHTGMGPCCEVHDGPGCQDPETTACVCELIPECCTVGWTEACTVVVIQKHCEPGVRECVCGSGDGQWQLQATCCMGDWSNLCSSTAVQKCGAAETCF